MMNTRNKTVRGRNTILVRVRTAIRNPVRAENFPDGFSLVTVSRRISRKKFNSVSLRIVEEAWIARGENEYKSPAITATISDLNTLNVSRKIITAVSESIIACAIMVKGRNEEGTINLITARKRG